MGGWQGIQFPFCFLNGVHESGVLFLVLITERVLSPRLRIYKRCRSGVCTPKTGHLPTGIAGSVVLLESSIGVATPVGAVVGETLQVNGALSGTFWLTTYSR